jgi:non-ribosomal peptide synthetase component F
VPDSVGVPIPGTSVQVVDEDGQPVGPGIVGELVVRGPHVAKGYWNDAEATAQVLQPDGEGGEMLLTPAICSALARTVCPISSSAGTTRSRTGEKVAPRQIEK